jgi:hypothetical protein
MTTDKYRKLNEAFEQRKFQKGTIQFKSHTINDKHIQDTINIIAKFHGIPASKIVKEIEDKVAKFKEIADKAPLLYGTIVKNTVESEVFQKFQEVKGIDIKGAPKFDATIFWRLIRDIKVEHDQFLPLRSFTDPKRLYEPVILLLPDPKRPDLNSIETAAASPKGEFYFDTEFMQDLMTFAHIKGVVPKGKKYVSNGGDTPDEYCWVEFLIIHEFLHYTYSDFHYQNEIPKADPKIINWVGDFRSNYMLVKSGYEQLPIGLFNDDINYDRQTSYKQMYNLVAAEFSKLNKKQQQMVQEELDGMSDDHDTGQQHGKEEGGKTPGPADPNAQPQPKGQGQKPEGEEQKGPYYVEDDYGNLTINGRDIAKKVPTANRHGNIRIGHKDSYNEVKTSDPLSGQEQTVLTISKKDYHIDSNGNIVVRIKKQKDV